jgi:hypothetical protein
MHRVFCWLDTPYTLSEYVCHNYVPHTGAVTARTVTWQIIESGFSPPSPIPDFGDLLARLSGRMPQKPPFWFSRCNHLGRVVFNSLVTQPVCL